MIRSVPEIGRLKKIAMLPEGAMMSDCRKLVSIMGPRTKARTRGAGSKLYRLMTYPIRPNKIVAKTSVTLLFRAYAPKRTNMIIRGERRL